MAKITDGLRLRPDGVYERQETINGVRRSFSSKDPRKVWEKYRAALNAEKSKDTFKAIAAQWWEEHSKKVAYGSLRPYTPAYNRAVDAFGKQNISTITPQKVSAYIAQLGEKYAYKTVCNHLTVLRQIFRYAIIKGVIESDPSAYVTVPAHLRRSTRQLLTDEQMDKIKNSADKPHSLLALLILYTGARCNEALALMWDDVGENSISINKAVVHHGNAPVIESTKTAAGIRTVPLLSPLKAILAQYPREPGKYIIGGGKTPLLKSQLDRYWELYLQEIGLKQGSIDRHQIRHEYATMLYEAGVDEKVAQTLMGHSDIATTRNIYTHIRQSRMEQAAQSIETYLQSNCRATTKNNDTMD